MTPKQVALFQIAAVLLGTIPAIVAGFAHYISPDLAFGISAAVATVVGAVKSIEVILNAPKPDSTVTTVTMPHPALPEAMLTTVTTTSLPTPPPAAAPVPGLSLGSK